ncbi:MAG: pyridoxal phosphate-dependent aminotransferase [Acidobacteria bacterium]|nr:MAG: pyridoxal phosphate-dependent aminotransferase [Acidobacteriota bacterium]
MFSSRTDWLLAPNRLTWQLEERRRRGLPVLDLTESNPTRCGFAPDPKILNLLQDPRSLTYEPDPRGPLSARRAVCEYYAARGASVTPEQVFLTTSTSEAYTYAFRLLADPGDKVLVPQPSYPLFDFLAGINDLEVVSYPIRYSHGWRIDLDGVQDLRLPGAKAMIVVHPNNPTGSYVKPRELEILTECCRHVQGALIADEVFADYSLEAGEDRVPSHAAVSDVLTFTLSGLSKVSALPQMKLGWVVVNGPKGELETALERLEVIADTYLSVSPPLALALPALLELRKMVQPRITERLRSNLRWLDQQMASCRNIKRLEAEGGWYAVLKVPETASDEDWAVNLLTADGVLVHPGHFYEFPDEGHLVISLLTDERVFREGAARVIARLSKSS